MLLQQLVSMKAYSARLLNLINQIMELSNLISGANKLSDAPANIAQVEKGIFED